MNSQRHIDRSCIFRQTFENGMADVVDNPYGKGYYIAGVTFSNNRINFVAGPTGGVVYNNSYSGPITIRFKGILTSSPGGYLLDGRIGASTTGVYIHFPTGVNTLSGGNYSGTQYLNGAVYANQTFNNTPVDIVVVTTAGALKKITLGRYNAASALTLTASWDLIEIYNRALSATEVALLYSGQMYKATKLNEQNCVFDLDVRDGVISDKSQYKRALTISGAINIVNDVVPSIKFPYVSSNISTPDFIGIDEVWGYIWFRPFFNSGGMPVGWGSLLDNRKFMFLANDTGGSRRIYMYSDGTTFYNTTQYAYKQTTWYCIGFYRKASGLMRIYINGVHAMAADQEYNSGTPQLPTQVLSIGRRPDSTGNFFNGRISKIKIFKETIPSNIKDIMAQIYNSERSYYGV